jgi:hypothetical protein
VKNAADMTKILNLQEEMFSDEIVKVLNVIMIQKKIQDKVPNSKWVEDMNTKISSDPDFS